MSQPLAPLTIGKHTSRLPVVQGGMGVGISNWRLAGAVAANGGVGTLSAAGLAQTAAYRDRFPFSGPEEFLAANVACVREEVRRAKEIADGGPAFINVMVAMNGYRELILAALEAGVDGIVSGAGMPFELPDIAKDFPDAALVPILSSARGAELVVKKWERKGRLPDAIVLEDPSRAGGHLGANKGQIAHIGDADTLMENAVPAAAKYFADRGLKVPVIAAGGIVDRADIDRVFAMGASGVQLGTRFLATRESGAHGDFKRAVLAAKSADEVLEYISSACLPARALRNSPVFARLALKTGAEPCRLGADCLKACAYRDAADKVPADAANMCIMDELGDVAEGGSGNGLYFVGTSALRIDTLLSVKEVMESLAG